MIYFSAANGRHYVCVCVGVFLVIFPVCVSTNRQFLLNYDELAHNNKVFCVSLNLVMSLCL